MIGRNHFIRVLLCVLVIFPSCSTYSLLVRHTDPLTPEQHMQLGASYEAQGLTEAAGQQYEAALRLQKKYIPAYIAKGNLAFVSGDLKKAETCYRQVLRLDRNHAGANNNLAMVYLSLGKDMDKAERYAQTALKQEGSLRPYVLETLASIYMQQGRTSLAWKVLEEAESAAPFDDPVLCAQLAKTREVLAMRTE